jgi:hypothetical protein
MISKSFIKVLGKCQISNSKLIINLFISLNKYKNEMEEEKERRKREEEDAKIPPGTRIMSELEKKQTLEEL